MTVKEMGPSGESLTAFLFQPMGPISLCKYPGVRGSAPRGAAGSQVLSSVTNFKSLRQVASYAIC
jgi:hypothetical protein